MIKKTIQALIWKLLMLETLIRGATRIKPAAWRIKLGERVLSYQMHPLGTRRLVLYSNNRAVYLNIPKAASTGLGRTLFENEHDKNLFDRDAKIKNLSNHINTDRKRAPHAIKRIRYLPGKKWIAVGWDKDGERRNKKISLDKINSYFIFTFVRNPFTRFVSLFQNKYRYQHGAYFTRLKIYTIPIFIKISSFDELAHKIYKVPDCYLNPHFFPQSLPVEYFTQLGGKIDFIGRLENISEEFEELRQRLDLLPLEHRNKSSGEKKDWRDYYTPKTAKLIYKRYRKDFEMFGYEDEYPKLLEYLASRADRSV